MNKMIKLVERIKKPIGYVLYGKEFYTKMWDSNVYQEKLSIEEEIKELKKVKNRLRYKIRRESDEQKRNGLELRLSEVIEKIKILQEELIKCKEKTMSGCISIPLSPVLVPLLSSHDRYSVIKNILSVDNSKGKILDVLQSTNIEDSHDKYSE